MQCQSLHGVQTINSEYVEGSNRGQTSGTIAAGARKESRIKIFLYLNLKKKNFGDPMYAYSWSDNAYVKTKCEIIHETTRHMSDRQIVGKKRSER